MTHQPAISFSISFLSHFNRAGGRTSNVLGRLFSERHQPLPVVRVVFRLLRFTEDLLAGVVIQQVPALLQCSHYRQRPSSIPGVSVSGGEDQGGAHRPREQVSGAQPAITRFVGVLL